jgi:hypothetical protein
MAEQMRIDAEMNLGSQEAEARLGRLLVLY